MSGDWNFSGWSEVARAAEENVEVWRNRLRNAAAAVDHLPFDSPERRSCYVLIKAKLAALKMIENGLLNEEAMTIRDQVVMNICFALLDKE